MSHPNAAPTAPRSSSRRGPAYELLARLGGIAMDLLLLALFLFLGVATLDVLIKIIVLVVGYAQAPDPRLVADGLFPNWDPKRHVNDLRDLGLAVAIAVAAVFAFLGGLRARRYLLSRVIDASFESFVSKRYLISRSSGSLVNLITVVSVLGVSVGVMALVVVISVMNGFDSILVKRMMGVFAHVEVWPPFAGEDFEFPAEDAERIIEIVEGTDGVVAAAPLLSRQTFFQADTGIGEEKVGALLRGVDFSREHKVTEVAAADSILAGTGNPEFREVLLGKELARKLRVDVGDKIYALGKVRPTALGPKGAIRSLRVAGVFQTGIYNVDENFAYATMATVQDLFLAEDQVGSIHIRIDEPEKVQVVRARIRENLFEAFGTQSVFTRTWDEINPEFFEALWIEKVAMFIILLLIVIVASLNIIGTLILVVTQKTREIGILKSMGATSAMILRIFLYHGFFIGVVGTTLGTAWGLWICRFVDRDIEKIFQIPSAVYLIDRLPVIVEPGVIGFLAGCALLICLLAGIIPAFKAARMDPVEALRYD
ncbi:MAG: ABC transporter permease [Sumerlaeia bacterium]